MPTLADLHTQGRFWKIVAVERNGVNRNVAELYWLNGGVYVHEFDTGLVKRICDYN